MCACSLSLDTVRWRQAVGKYEEAGDHAIRCYDYYLEHSGSEDTDVLTRLGNLQVSFSYVFCYCFFRCLRFVAPAAYRRAFGVVLLHLLCRPWRTLV